MYAMAKIANLAKNRQTADENLNEVIKVLLTKWRGWRKWRIWQNSPWVWKTFKLNDKSGLLESGDHDENGEYDENSESSHQWRKIARGLAKMLIRLEGALLAKTKNWRNGESDKNGESGKKSIMGLTNIQVGMPRVAPWKVANLTKMANKEKMTNLAIIRPRCNKLLM